MNRYQKAQKVATYGMLGNLFLLIIKLWAGLAFRSQAMLADGINSLGDVFASSMTFLGNKVASRPQDEDHPFGHGKAEYIFSFLIAIAMLAVAARTLYSSFMSIIEGNTIVFSPFLVAVCAATILIKSCLYVYAKRAASQENNLLILANAQDHRNDVFVTLGTLLGIAGSSLGWKFLDGAVGIAISLWIAYTGVVIFIKAYRVLMDTGLGETTYRRIADIVSAVDGVDHIDSIEAKPVGFQYILFVKVSVDGEMSVNQSHAIAATIRYSLKELSDVSDVMVHINPC